MILVFAGPNNSPVQPGMHTYIGSCDTIAEATTGFEEWCRQQQLEWYTLLARRHPTAEAQAMSDRATFWHQFVEFNAQGEAKILQESQPQWSSAKDAHELHAAREALECLEKMERAGQDGDPGAAESYGREADQWIAEWKARRER